MKLFYYFIFNTNFIIINLFIYKFSLELFNKYNNNLYFYDINNIFNLFSNLIASVIYNFIF